MNARIPPQPKDHCEIASKPDSQPTRRPLPSAMMPGPQKYESSREQLVHAAAVVLERLGDGDAELLDEVSDGGREVLAALFQEGKRTPPKGTRQQVDEAKRGVVPLQLATTSEQRRTREEARVYRAKVRRWARAKGRFVGSRGTLDPGLIADYEAANGGAS